MSTLTDKFDELETLLAGQATTLGAYIDTVETKLQAVLDLMDIMNENNAANTKYLIAALGQSGTCFPCPSPPMVVPPVGTTPGEADTDRCQRAQAMIAVIRALLENMDTMQSFNVIGTYNVVYGAISDYIGAIAAGDTVPLPSAPEAINIVGDYVSYAGERVFSGVGLVEQFDPLVDSLIAATFTTTTPEAAQSAYNAIIEASGVSNGARLLFEAIAYNALWSYYFDPGTDPDLSAYSGGLCSGLLGCRFLESTETHFSGATIDAIAWPPDLAPTATPPGVSADVAVWATVNMNGWSFLSDTAVTAYYNSGDTGDNHMENIPWTASRDSTYFAIRNNAGTGTFTLQFCPPGETPEEP